MALSRIEVRFLERALDRGTIAQGGHILELGESQLSQAETGAALLNIISGHIPQRRRREAERRMVQARKSLSRYQQTYGPARALYHAIFEPKSYSAVGLYLQPRQFCLDLNRPLSLDQQFDIVINNRVSEHIFDQANVFEAMHTHTRPGGIMLHWIPCLNWITHGMYALQPRFFFDLAAANGYDAELVGFGTSEVFAETRSAEEAGAFMEQNARNHRILACAALRKTSDRPFVTPGSGATGSRKISAEIRLARVKRIRRFECRRNLALNRPALQSSTCEWSWHDDPALDAAGGNNGQVTGYFGFHTDFEPEPWWMVDLGKRQKLTEVVIYNRMDQIENPAARAGELNILLSNNGSDWRIVFTRTEDRPFGGADGNPLRVRFGNETARYVRVRLAKEGSLHLDEIEVF